MNKPQVIAVDVDNTLTNGVSFTISECIAAVPNNGMINFVNELYANNFIIIYTARKDELIPATIKWLKKYGIQFHAISNNKIPADLYIDKNSINVIPSVQ